MVETILAAIEAARQLSDLAVRLTALAESEMTPEELATIRQRARQSDEAWDAAVAAERQRQQSQG